jgi:hypothetical protein
MQLLIATAMGRRFSRIAVLVIRPLSHADVPEVFALT